MGFDKDQLVIFFLKEWNDWWHADIFYPILARVIDGSEDQIGVLPVSADKEHEKMASSNFRKDVQCVDVASERVLSLEDFHRWMTNLMKEYVDRKPAYESLLAELKFLGPKDIGFHKVEIDGRIYWRPCFRLPASRSVFRKTEDDSSTLLVASAGRSLHDMMNLMNEPYDFIDARDYASLDHF